MSDLTGETAKAESRPWASRADRHPARRQWQATPPIGPCASAEVVHDCGGYTPATGAAETGPVSGGHPPPAPAVMIPRRRGETTDAWRARVLIAYLAATAAADLEWARHCIGPDGRPDLMLPWMAPERADAVGQREALERELQNATETMIRELPHG